MERAASTGKKRLPASGLLDAARLRPVRSGVRKTFVDFMSKPRA
jgi:hypothetical protein